MNRGRKPPNPEAKRLAGTHRPDRHANVVALPVNTTTPTADITAPPWLTAGAKAVWSDELKRLIATGATEADTSMLALYAETLATFISQVKAGDTPTAAFRSELRKQMELLGIAGVKSRLTRMTAAPAATSSPFSVRKK